MTNLILLQADPPASNVVEIIKAVGGVIAIIGGILSPFILYYVNKMNAKVSGVATKVDGLMAEKTLADKALGDLAAIERAAKEKGIADARELQVLKEQQLLNQNPPNLPAGKNVKDDIVKSVETNAEKTQEIVRHIPEEVVKKLPPPV